MYRRNLTRIEIKIEDIQDFEKIKKETDFEQQYEDKSFQNSSGVTPSSGGSSSTGAGNSDGTGLSSAQFQQQIRQQRIGFKK